MRNRTPLSKKCVKIAWKKESTCVWKPLLVKGKSARRKCKEERVISQETQKARLKERKKLVKKESENTCKTKICNKRLNERKKGFEICCYGYGSMCVRDWFHGPKIQNRGKLNERNEEMLCVRLHCFQNIKLKKKWK